LFDRYSMKHMVNNRMFTKPLSLNAIGAAGGLSAPISMLALRGKTIYNSTGTATVIPTTGTVSLFSFENKTFTSPVNPVIFKSPLYYPGGTISEAGKNVSLLDIGRDSQEVRIGGGNNLPFYLNISVTSTSILANYYRAGFSDVNYNYVTYSPTPNTKSYYFTSGLTEDSIWFFYDIDSGEATITNTARYTTIENFIYP